MLYDMGCNGTGQRVDNVVCTTLERFWAACSKIAKCLRHDDCAAWQVLHDNIGVQLTLAVLCPMASNSYSLVEHSYRSMPSWHDGHAG